MRVTKWARRVVALVPVVGMCALSGAFTGNAASTGYAVTTPLVSIGDVTAVMGGETSVWAREMLFRVTLSEPATTTVTVNYTVNPGTATIVSSCNSFANVAAKPSGSVVFHVHANGFTATQMGIGITVCGGRPPGGTFTIEITGVTGAVPGRAIGTGTILAPFAPSPAVDVGDATIVEGNAGARSLVIPVSCSSHLCGNTSVHYTVTAASATFGTKKASATGADYGGKTAGTLTFKGTGTQTKNIVIPIWPDPRTESNETFTVTLPAALNPGVRLGKDTGTGTIIDDD